MILITGANGHPGTAAIQFLRKNSPEKNITALNRSKKKDAELREEGTELSVGDYRERQSLDRAMREVTTLLLISTSTMENRTEQHKNVIEAAGDAGAEQIFCTSMLQADKKLSPLAYDHHETEKILKKSGIPHTIENLLGRKPTSTTEFIRQFVK